MEIKNLGNKSLFIKGKKESVLINPTEEDYKSKQYQSRIVIFTNKEEDKVGLVRDKVIVRGAGEYEVGGVEILGLNGGEANSVYVITIDGISLMMIDELSQELTEKKIEKINAVDVMVANIADSKVMGPKQILELSKKLGANYIIPTGYTESKENLTKFLDEADAEGAEGVDSLKIDKKDDLPDGMEVVVLKEI